MAVLCCLGSAFSGITAFSLSDYKQKSLATATPTLFPIRSLPGTNNSQGLPGEITGKMDEIQTQVIQIRGLIPKQSLNRELLSPDQLKQNVITDFLGEYTGEEARTDATVLTTLGLLEPDFDLISFYRDLYSEQIAGYYDDADKEMYVVQGSGFGGQESSTYAHEYLHALQDQNYDLRKGLKFNPEDCELDPERCTGAQALIEGDATVTEQKWLTGYASSDTRQEILEFYTQFKSPVYDSAPEYMKRDFLFPYQSGSEFVFSLLDRGGWQAVNAAYLQPPASSEQIMHPELYPDDKPIPVEIKDLSDIIGKDWKEIDGGVLGEWYTYLVFAWGYRPEYRIPDSEARIAAAGWGGDKYVVYQNQSNNSILFAQKMVLDTDLDAEQYWNTLLKYETMRWNEPSAVSTDRVEWYNSSDKVIITRYDDSVYRVISPDQQLTSSVIKSISR
jgi:hypothetical protein